MVTRIPRAAIPLVLAGALLFSGSPGALADGNTKIRIAVLDFDTSALHGSWRWSWSWNELATAAADSVTHELVNSGRFRVIERSRLDEVLREQDLGDSGRIDPSTAAGIGKVLGVQLVVLGSVTEFGIEEYGGRLPQIGKWKFGRGLGGKLVKGNATLTARVIDTTTAEILGSYEGSGTHKFGKGQFSGASFGKNFDTTTTSKVLKAAAEQVARQIAAAAADLEPSTVRGGIEGKVAKVSGDTVYLNVGEAQGVRVGDRFEIRRLGEVIRDPDTGEVLGGDEMKVGVVEVTKVLGAKLATARVVEGGTMEVGDRAVMR